MFFLVVAFLGFLLFDLLRVCFLGLLGLFKRASCVRCRRKTDQSVKVFLRMTFCQCLFVGIFKLSGCVRGDQEEEKCGQRKDHMASDTKCSQEPPFIHILAPFLNPQNTRNVRVYVAGQSTMSTSDTHHLFCLGLALAENIKVVINH